LVKVNQVRRKGNLARRDEDVHGAGVPVAGRSGAANPRVDGKWAGPSGGGEGDASSLSLRWRRCGFLIAGENILAAQKRSWGTLSDQPASPHTVSAASALPPVARVLQVF
jgi:hypothetical protein